jgi:hypothetical protein
MEKNTFPLRNHIVFTTTSVGFTLTRDATGFLTTAKRSATPRVTAL